MSCRSAALSMLLLAALAATPTAAPGAQEWKTLVLASFDEVWQTVHDSFYDPTFGGVDWAAARTQLRPSVERAETPDEARAAIRALLAKLGRSHFALISPAAAGSATPGAAGVPVDTRVVDGHLVVTRVDADHGGLNPGDRIVTIDGVVVSISADRTAPDSSEADRPAARAEAWRDATRALSGPLGSVADLGVLTPPGQHRRVRVARQVLAGEEVTLGHLPPLHVRTDVSEAQTPNGVHVGVIRFNVWMTAVAEPFAQGIDRFRSAGGLVIDLRGNPGGLADMTRGLAGHLLAEPALLGRMQMRNLVLEFRANPRRSTSDGRRVEPFAGPVAILVDELTASASECFAGGLQSLGRARVFGARTMGQALPASTRQLPNGDVLLYAIGDFVTSTGQRLEGIGVMPDTTVPLSLGDVAAGRDRRLEAALAWIDRVRSPNAPPAARR